MTTATKDDVDRSRQRAALVLSGGGALGVAHLGAVAVLQQRYEFDWFCGVSAGAIVAAGLAIGLPIEEVYARVKKTKILSLLFAPPLLRSSVFSSRKIEQKFRELFGDRRIEQLELPLTIGATDLESGESVYLRSGSLVEALMATTAVPILFEPCLNQSVQRYLVDGGLSCNLPVEYALASYAQHQVLAIDVATSLKTWSEISSKRRMGRSRTMADMATQAIRLLLKSQQSKLPNDPRLTVIRPKLAEFAAFNTIHLDQMFERGKQSV